MRVRQLDDNGDWTFGSGKNNYLVNNAAVAQNIATRLRSFLGDAFFDLSAGIDWFNLLGSKNERALLLAISTVIRNTDQVIGILELSARLDQNRNITVVYNVQTTFSNVNNSFVFNLGSGT